MGGIESSVINVKNYFILRSGIKGLENKNLVSCGKNLKRSFMNYKKEEYNQDCTVDIVFKKREMNEDEIHGDVKNVFQTL